jgi:nucleoside-diphosphate-sugar epimerase
MSRVLLVTGAGGFVGSAVVRLLVRRKNRGRSVFSGGAPVDHVVALLRPGGSTECLEELPRTGEWSIRYADLTDRRELERLLADLQPCAIVHAALDSETYRDLPESEQHRLNVLPLEALFEGLRGTPGARFVHTGSAWVLPAGDGLDERVELEPRSAYAKSKARADRCLPMLGDRTGVPWINLRLFNMFGKYEKPSRLLPYLVSRLTEGQEALLSHGNQIRDFNDVDDMAQAYLLALEAPEGACGAVYHIGSGRGTTARDFAAIVATFTGQADRMRFDASSTPDQGVPCLVANPALARHILGWSPAADLESRVRRAVEWWLDRRVRDGKPAIHPGVSS